MVRRSGSGFSTPRSSAQSASCWRRRSASPSGSPGSRPNWIVSKIALVYVEIMRNTPLLLQLLFWYNAVLKALPGPRQSIRIPRPGFPQQSWPLRPATAIGRRAPNGSARRSARESSPRSPFASGRARRQARTGEQAPVGVVAALLCLGLPLVAYFAAGRPVSFDFAHLVGFNWAGACRSGRRARR